MTSAALAARVSTPVFPPKVLSCLKRPGGSDDDRLDLLDDRLRCAGTGAEYSFVDGIPSLFAPGAGTGEAVTTKVKAFYEEHPFPSYDGVEEFGELVAKGNANPFSKALLSAVGFNKLVLECGCGTGQLTHFLQLNNNHTLGVDMSLGSLALALEHKRRNGLYRSSFAQMNIFDLAIKDNSFDVAIAHGVLHHTFDAKRAFASVVSKVKPGGIIMVGLYNRYARVPTWLRSKLIGILGPKLDFVVRTRINDPRKAEVWIKDQYYNPHETWHSIDEVLDWFGEYGIEYLNCSPPILNTDGETAPTLFEKTEPGNAYERVVTQLFWLGSIAREGALFDLVGRKAT